MKFNAYNTASQKLNSNELAKIIQYSSDNYAGAISKTNPISIDDSGWRWVVPNASLLGAGILFEAEGLNQTNNVCTDGKIWAIVIDLDKFDNNITTQEIKNVKVTEISGTVEKSDKSPGLYNITFNGSSSWEYKFNTQIFNGITGTSEKQLVIPICAIIDGKIEQLLGYKDKSSLHDFLTSAIYDQLKKYIDETFVWHEGGQEKIGEYSKGDIGNLNITNSNVTSNTDKLYIDIKELYVKNISEIDAIDDSSNKGKVLIVNKDRGIELGFPKISEGGTGASTPLRAKQNLGITYGKDIPTKKADEGDIYFYILPESN